MSSGKHPPCTGHVGPVAAQGLHNGLPVDDRAPRTAGDAPGKDALIDQQPLLSVVHHSARRQVLHLILAFSSCGRLVKLGLETGLETRLRAQCRARNARTIFRRWMPATLSRLTISPSRHCCIQSRTHCAIPISVKRDTSAECATAGDWRHWRHDGSDVSDRRWFRI